MKVRIIKEHINYPFGEHEVSEERGNYLIAMNVAEKADEKAKPKQRRKRKTNEL